MKTALTIAGSDSSGGAGIQADIKTMTLNGVYAMSALTALTAQNTTGVSAISEVDPEFLGKQIDAVFDDIRPDAVKIGMLYSTDAVRTVVKKLIERSASNIVVDPVMVSTSGSQLIMDDTVEVLAHGLFPIASLVTPNIPEAERITGMTIINTDDMEAAAANIAGRFGCSVLLKGGHSTGDAVDILYIEGTYMRFETKRINNPNTHGTGCTLSSAIAANLAKGFDIESSVKRAKEYLSGALLDMLDLGMGSGPLNHAFDLKSRFAESPVNGQTK